MRGFRHEAGPRARLAGCAAFGLDQAARIELAVDRGVQGGAWVERAQARVQALDRCRVRVGLGDYQPIGENDLLARFRRPFERGEAARRIDHRREHLDVKLSAQRAVGGEGLQDRPGIGEPLVSITMRSKCGTAPCSRSAMSRRRATCRSDRVLQQRQPLPSSVTSSVDHASAHRRSRRCRTR